MLQLTKIVSEQYEPGQSELTNLEIEDVVQVVSDLIASGAFRYPVPVEVKAHFVDDVEPEYFALSCGWGQIADALRSDPTQGWAREQIPYLGSGFDMALMLIHAIEHRAGKIRP